MTPSFAAENNDGILTPDCDVVINEFLVVNDTTMSDQNGEFNGWIELFNNSDENFSLFGFYLNNVRDLTGWAFPDTTITGHSYLIVWADSDTLQPGLHANFELSAEGGSVFFVAPDDAVIRLRRPTRTRMTGRD